MSQKRQTVTAHRMRFAPILGSLTLRALEALYPSRCGLCGLLGPCAICDVCRGEMIPLDDATGEPETTGALDGWARLFRYEGRADQAVKRLKFARVTSLGAPMSDDLWRFAKRLGLADADLFVPVPIHWRRRCYRGFNQAELLCQAFPRNRVNASALVRTRATRPQVGLTPAERRRNLEGAFRCRTGLAGAKVVIVDDVLTTGYTALECAKVLRAAGAVEVFAVTFAGA